MNRFGENASAFLPYLLLLHSYFLLYKILSDFVGGDEENRTPDPLLARQVLSQLSYTPIFWENGPKWTRTTDLTLIRRAL